MRLAIKEIDRGKIIALVSGIFFLLLIIDYSILKFFLVWGIVFWLLKTMFKLRNLYLIF